MAELPITVRDYQVELDRLLQLKTPKFYAIPIGRRWGKTYLIKDNLLTWMHDTPGLYLWGDTVSKNIDAYYNLYFKPILEQYPKRYWKYNIQKQTLNLLDSTLHFRSADKPENWEGFGYKKIILNEAGIIMRNRYLYDHAVKPMLLDHPDSQLIAIGVPKGPTGKGGEPHPFKELADRAKLDLELPLEQRRYIYYHATTYDNTFLSREDIDLIFANSDPISISQERDALFVTRGGKLAVYCFDENVHVAECKYNPLETLYLSFDFNRNPATCSISQQGEILNGSGQWYKHWIDEVYLEDHQASTNGTYVEQVCDIIITKYGKPGVDAHYTITGDATGRAGNAALPKNVNAWRQVRDKFGPNVRYRVQSTNPTQENSLIQTNVVFSRESRIETRIDSKCKETIKDLANVKTKEDGTIDKGADERRSHILDCVRYDCWWNLPQFRR